MSFLSAEDELVARLNEKVSARIYSADELSSIEERAQVSPSVHVIYDGYTPTQEIANGAIQQVEHRWLIIIAVKSVKDTKSQRDKASPLIDETLEAMLGHQPTTELDALRMADAPAPVYTANFAYFPLAFTARATYRGLPR